MANIVIVSKGTNGILVDFGIYETTKNPSPQGFNVNDISNVRPYTVDGIDGVLVVMGDRNGQDWLVCKGTLTGFMTIDLIDGVAPTDNDDLISKLIALT